MISVLIVDDNHSFVDSLKVILKDIKSITYIKSLSNFQSVQKELDKTRFDLIILENDAEVGIKGIDFALDLMKQQKGFQSENFIILSHRVKEIADRAKAERLVHFKKPLNINDFKDHILKLVENEIFK